MEIIWLIIPMSIIAVLYASVGHGGASGYLAVMALYGLAPEFMKPTALTLNLLVSALATVAFYRGGFFHWRLFLPFAAFSVPAAWLGGQWSPDPTLFRILIAVVLAYSAVRLFLPQAIQTTIKRPAPWAFVLVGTTIGLLSGLIGVGGGIFLTPLLLLFGWARPKEAAAVSAPFIFVNSAAGLLGYGMAGGPLPQLWMSLAPAVLVGGYIGARWGSRFAKPIHIRRSLSVVLLIATLKLVLT